MKHATVILLPLFLCATLLAKAQPSNTETEIRRLEKAQCDAILQRDSVALYKLWADDFTVNSPTNDVVKLPSAKWAFRSGFIDYSLFEVHLENIIIFKDMVITMGSETIKPIGKSPMAGQTVNRRYTNIWLRTNGEWKIVARHANLVTDLKPGPQQG